MELEYEVSMDIILVLNGRCIGEELSKKNETTQKDRRSPAKPVEESIRTKFEKQM